MMYASVEHVAVLAESLRSELECNPDLLAVAAMAEKLCQTDPAVAAQVMLTLCAWLPTTDTPDDRATRAQILAGYRLAENLTNLKIAGAA